MTGLILWLAAGVTAGVGGRLLLPGPSGSWILSVLAGVGGALAGGVAATLMDMGGIAELDLRAGVLALLSASLLVLVLQLIRVWRT